VPAILRYGSWAAVFPSPADIQMAKAIIGFAAQKEYLREHLISINLWL
jgi:hypothetical protein